MEEEHMNVRVVCVWFGLEQGRWRDGETKSFSLTFTNSS